jgi:hypothetical protein
LEADANEWAASRPVRQQQAQGILIAAAPCLDWWLRDLAGVNGMSFKPPRIGLVGVCDRGTYV